jgi:hypothetical protein
MELPKETGIPIIGESSGEPEVPPPSKNTAGHCTVIMNNDLHHISSS